MLLRLLDCAILTQCIEHTQFEHGIEHDVHVRTIVRNKSKISVGEREQEHVLADVTESDCDVRYVC